MPAISSFPSYETGQFTTPSGATLGYQSVGSGPPIVLANGLGGTFHTWRHLLQFFADRHRIVSWDYRGLHSSPPPPNRKALHMPHHVDDMEAMLDYFEIDQAIFVGWSMGVQVNFELYRRRPETFAALAIFNGTAGSPFSTILGGKFIHRIVPAVLKEVKKTANKLSAVTKAVGQWDGTIEVFKQLGVVANTIDDEVFSDLLGEFGSLDFALYMDLLRAIGEHDAWDILPKISCPTAIVSSDNDILTPLDTAQRMRERIPGATLEVITNCTHYGAVEHPERYNKALSDLMIRAGW